MPTVSRVAGLRDVTPVDTLGHQSLLDNTLYAESRKATSHQSA